MIITTKSWKSLFLLCLGLATAAAFCMKWMEPDFWSQGDKFTILGLELFYSKEKVINVLSGLSAPVKMILRYHLSFDFAFMAGIYPGIAALCMMARGKVKGTSMQKLLYVFAVLQLPAWLADCAENYYLLQWIDKPVMGNEFGFYHFIVSFKWLIAVSAAVVAIFLNLRKSHRGRQRSGEPQ